MRNVKVDFLLDPKMIEMLLLPNFQLTALMIFILKIQYLTQQTHQHSSVPKRQISKITSPSVAEAGGKRKRSADHKMASCLQPSYKHVTFHTQHQIESNTSLACLITQV